MFDFSMGELMVVMVVALVVIGPERLPKVARTLGHLYGRAQRYVNGVKSDIARDMAIEEYRQLQQKIQAEASSLQESVQQTAQTASQQMQQINRAIIEQVQDIQQSVEPVANTPGLGDAESHTLESVEKQVAEHLSQDIRPAGNPGAVRSIAANSASQQMQQINRAIVEQAVVQADLFAQPAPAVESSASQTGAHQASTVKS